MLAKRKKGSSASPFTIKSYAIFILVILVLVTVVTFFDTTSFWNNISSIGKSYILSSTTTIISNKNISSSCCTFRSWEPWEFCPSSANGVIDLPIYEAASVDEMWTNQSLSWNEECMVRKSWSFADPLFEDVTSCLNQPIFDYFVREKRVHPLLKGSRILFLGDSTLRMMFHDICAFFLPEEFRRGNNSPYVKGKAWDFGTPTQWANWTSNKVTFDENFGETKAKMCLIAQDDFSLAWSMIFSADDIPGDPGLASYQAGGLEKTNTTWRISQVKKDLLNIPSWGEDEKQPTLVVFGSCYWDLTLVKESATDEQVATYGAAVQDRGTQLRELFPDAELLFQTCFLGHKAKFKGMTNSNENRYATMARQIATSTASEWNGLVDPWTVLQKHAHLSFDGIHYPQSVSLAVFNLALSHINVCEHNHTVSNQN